MERFIIGTGRCGSTLLSRMLAESPQILSIFEFFTGLDMARRFGPEPMEGREFAEIISAEQPFVTAVLRRGYRVEEITYPFDEPSQGDRPRARRRPEEALPWILVSMLPRLSNDPDALFEEVVEFARGRPLQRPNAHYREFFEWLTRKLDRELWIERSGSSIDYVGSLIEEFSEARFVHIHREAPEVALSMREHHAYRLPISLMYDVPLSSGRRVSELPPIDLHGVPSQTDTITQILACRPPAEYFGHYWSDQIVRGFAALDHFDSTRYLEVKFEDLVRRPRDVLTRIAEFFAIDYERRDWIERGAHLIRGIPPLRLDSLAPDERERLLEACRPGRELMERAGPLCG